MRASSIAFIVALGLVAAACNEEKTGSSESSVSSPASASASLPPSEGTAKAALDNSPRHGEYVDIPLAGSATPLRAWIVYPERKDKAGVVILIHEIYGLSDWMRGVADQVAREGFIALAPDLISGR